MSVRRSNHHYFLTLNPIPAATNAQNDINTDKDNILTLRIENSTLFSSTKFFDLLGDNSLICDAVIQAR